jgi:hypothetical protein
MTTKAKTIAPKMVNVSVNIDNSHRFDFTVEIPPAVENDYQALSLTGTSSVGKKFKLDYLGIATMELLVGLGHATSWDASEEEGHYWTLDSSRTKKCWGTKKWRSEAPTLTRV